MVTRRVTPRPPAPMPTPEQIEEAREVLELTQQDLDTCPPNERPAARARKEHAARVLRDMEARRHRLRTGQAA